MSRRSRNAIAFILFAVLVTATATWSDSPKPPPDIQAILDKQKNHQPLTGADIQKLIDWGKGVAQHVGVPNLTGNTGSGSGSGSALPAPIPVRITGSLHVTEDTHHEKLTTHDDWDASYGDNGAAVVDAALDGTQPWEDGVLDPKSKTGKIDVIQLMNKTQTAIQQPGTGNVNHHSHVESTDPQGHTHTVDSTMTGTITLVGCGISLTTNGGDTLWPRGGCNGSGQGSETVTDSSSGTHTNNVGASLPGVLSAPFAWEGKFGGDPNKHHPTPKLAFSFAAWKAGIQGSGGATFTGSESFDFGDNETHWSVTSSITIELRPSDTKPDVVVTPANYDKWVPEGAADGSTSDGNTIKVTATIKSKDGKPLQVGHQVTRVSFQLQNVSQEWGTSMNYPAGQGAETQNDLKFVQSSQASAMHVKDDGATCDHDGADTTLTCVVTAYDFGAWGDLLVTAYFQDGGPVVGHLQSKNPGTIPLPERIRDGSKIAKGWDHAGDVSNDSADDESKPAGNGFAGDGLTAYEEYRGFMCGGQHIRTDPKTKDLFIRNEIGGDAATGLGYLKAATQLAVHDCLTASEMPPSRVMNANHSAGPHVVDQHALDLLSSASSEAEAIGPPVKVDHVYVGPKPSGARERNEWDASVAHELLHGLNVNHHGSGDRTPVTWARGADGKIFERWAEADPKHPDKTIGHSDAITVEDESGHVLGGNDPAVNALFTSTDPQGNPISSQLYIATWNGEHSGDENCLMRYSFSFAMGGGQYETIFVDHNNPLVRRLVTKAEKIGTGLCSHPTGTGVNQQGRSPVQWHGDAQRGDCAHQFVVNDKYSN